MSAFRRYTEGYHFQSKSQAEGVELLRRAGVHGLVFPPTNSWVTLIEGHGSDGTTMTDGVGILKANLGLLVYYGYAEDFGWELNIYEGTNPISQYQCSWFLGDPDATPENIDTEYSPEALQRCITNQDYTAADFGKMLHPQSLDDAFEEEPDVLLRAALGLKYTELREFHSTKGERQRCPDRYPAGIIEV